MRSVWLPLDFKIRKVKDTRRKSVPRKNMWKLHEDRAGSQKDAFVESCYSILKGALPEATNRSSGLAKGTPRYKETVVKWWWRPFQERHAIAYACNQTCTEAFRNVINFTHKLNFSLHKFKIKKLHRNQREFFSQFSLQAFKGYICSFFQKKPV